MYSEAFFLANIPSFVEGLLPSDGVSMIKCFQLKAYSVLLEYSRNIPENSHILSDSLDRNPGLDIPRTVQTIAAILGSRAAMGLLGLQTFFATHRLSSATISVSVLHRVNG